MVRALHELFPDCEILPKCDRCPLFSGAITLDPFVGDVLHCSRVCGFNFGWSGLSGKGADEPRVGKLSIESVDVARGTFTGDSERVSERVLGRGTIVVLL